MPIYEGIGLINEKHPIVIEIGHSLTKAGFAGEVSPRCIIPSTIKLKENPTRYRSLKDYESEEDLYQMFVEFLHYLYCKHLLVTPKERKVVIVESLFAPYIWRQVLAKVLYLHFEILNVLWIPSHLAAVTATGSQTGLVIDIGYEEIQLIPVFNGVTLLTCIIAQELGKKAFDENLKKLLKEKQDEKEYSPLLEDSRILEDLRVRACFVTTRERAEIISNDPENLSPKLKPFSYQLSGDKCVNIAGCIREIASEFWFQNDDIDDISIPLMVLNSLSKCPIDTRIPLASSILLTGGTSMLPGFKRRLLQDLKVVSLEERFLKHNFNDKYEFKVYDIAIKENCMAWVGGSIYGASEAMNLRGNTKESFLKVGYLPDWSNLIYNCPSSVLNGQSAPPIGSPSKSL